MDTTGKEKSQLYSLQSITIACLLGGPFAAGYLVYINYKNLGNSKAAKLSLYTGIIASFLILAGLLSMPDRILDEFPSLLIPVIYTIVIYFIVHKIQGKELKKYKAENTTFYSGWKAASIGTISMLFVFLILFMFFILKPNNFDAKSYHKGLNEVIANEITAIRVYSHLQTMDKDSLVNELDTDIQLWGKSIKVLDKLDKMENLTNNAKKQNNKFREYINYRIEVYKLLRKSIIEHTHKYDPQIKNLTREIKYTLREI